MSNRLFQGVIHQMKDSVDRTIGVIDENGVATPKIKLSDNHAKITNPGFKSLYRLYDRETGMAIADLITLREEKIDEGQPLTIFHPVETWKQHEVENFRAVELQQTIVKDGKLVYTFPSVKEVQEYSKGQLSKFWEEYLRLDLPQLYKVDLSDGLHKLKFGMIDSIRQKNAKRKKK